MHTRLHTEPLRIIIIIVIIIIIIIVIIVITIIVLVAVVISVSIGAIAISRVDDGIGTTVVGLEMQWRGCVDVDVHAHGRTHRHWRGCCIAPAIAVIIGSKTVIASVTVVRVACAWP